jgi:hypothetical protein
MATCRTQLRHGLDVVEEPSMERVAKNQGQTTPPPRRLAPVRAPNPPILKPLPALSTAVAVAVLMLRAHMLL